jgi:hypothetical protein
VFKGVSDSNPSSSFRAASGSPTPCATHTAKCDLTWPFADGDGIDIDSEEFGDRSRKELCSIYFHRDISDTSQMASHLANSLMQCHQRYRMTVRLPGRASSFLPYDPKGIVSVERLQAGRDSSIVARILDERNAAVKSMIASVIRAARASRRRIGICGQAPSDYP